MIWFHRHRWVAVAIDEGMCGATQVLYRCAKCGEPKTRVLPGHWTLAQVASRQPA